MNLDFGNLLDVCMRLCIVSAFPSLDRTRKHNIAFQDIYFKAECASHTTKRSRMFCHPDKAVTFGNGIGLDDLWVVDLTWKSQVAFPLGKSSLPARLSNRSTLPSSRSAWRSTSGCMKTILTWAYRGATDWNDFCQGTCSRRNSWCMEKYGMGYHPARWWRPVSHFTFSISHDKAFEWLCDCVDLVSSHLLVVEESLCGRM